VPILSEELARGEDFAFNYTIVVGEDYVEAQDSGEAKNLLMEAVTQFFNFIIKMTPLIMLAATVHTISKITKPKVKSPKRQIEKAAKIKR
jgi:hypothetical protein